METSHEGEPEHYSCTLACTEQRWSMSLNALQGLIEYRGSSPLHASLWMFPIHPTFHHHNSLLQDFCLIVVLLTDLSQ